MNVVSNDGSSPTRRAPKRRSTNVPATAVLCAVIMCSLTAAAQEPSAPSPDEVPPSAFTHHALYLEVLGAGLIASANYELRPWRPFSGRVGFFWGSGEHGDVYIVPVMAYWLHGQGPSKLEIGAGPTFFISRADVNHYNASLAVGYRYQPNTSGGMARIAWTPLFSLTHRPVDLGRHFLWEHFGFSFGATF